MGHKRRLQHAGLYHVTARSNAEEHICRDDGDYSTLLTYIVGSGLLCHWFCLMPTHYHVLVSVGDDELASRVHRINRRYATSFNRRYRRRGHVFDNPYSSVPVETDEHLLSAIRYIALNPADPENWRWSSYPGVIGRGVQFSFVDTRLVLEMFGTVEELRRFVNEGLELAAG